MSRIVLFCFLIAMIIVVIREWIFFIRWGLEGESFGETVDFYIVVKNLSYKRMERKRKWFLWKKKGKRLELKIPVQIGYDYTIGTYGSCDIQLGRGENPCLGRISIHNGYIEFELQEGKSVCNYHSIPYGERVKLLGGTNIKWNHWMIQIISGK